MEFLGELWRFARARKKLWLLPIFIILLILGALIIAVQGSALTPLIYTVF